VLESRATQKGIIARSPLQVISFTARGTNGRCLALAKPSIAVSPPRKSLRREPKPTVKFLSISRRRAGRVRDQRNNRLRRSRRWDVIVHSPSDLTRISRHSPAVSIGRHGHSSRYFFLLSPSPRVARSRDRSRQDAEDNSATLSPILACSVIRFAVGPLARGSAKERNTRHRQRRPVPVSLFSTDRACRCAYIRREQSTFIV